MVGGNYLMWEIPTKGFVIEPDEPELEVLKGHVATILDVGESRL